MTSKIPALDIHPEVIAGSDEAEYEDDEWKEF
jgi:hypothetical protein